jgi:hypothetical protein
MEQYQPMIIKSFKHNGSLHRTWFENWRLPDAQLTAEHRKEAMIVLVSDQTPIRDADGSRWTSRIPAVSFFLPNRWFNIIALVMDNGVRYYCNVASPPYIQGNVLTYIDYDLDVIFTPQRTVQVVDQDEYRRHRLEYHYSTEVEKKVAAGLKQLMRRVRKRSAPFRDETVLLYYREWNDQYKMR